MNAKQDVPKAKRSSSVMFLKRNGSRKKVLDFELQHCFSVPPSPELANELQWPVITKLCRYLFDLLPFFFKDARVHPKYESHCEAAGFVHREI